jgi:hypothetical protein
MDAVFAGWGAGHQYRFGSGKLSEVGRPYALREGLDEDFALDYGDLTIREWATDPDQNLAYGAFNAGGLRVVSFNSEGIKEQGRYIDGGGSTFFGVEQFTSGGRRLIAASDRDYGLYVFRYTGPDAPPDPSPPAQPAPPARPPAPRVARDATKPRIVSLSPANRSLRKLRAGTLSIRLRLDEASRVQVTLQGRLTRRGGGRGSLQRLARTTLSSVRANQTRTAKLRLSSGYRRRLRSERRLPARVSIRVTDVVGNVTTRNVSLTFR